MLRLLLFLLLAPAAWAQFSSTAAHIRPVSSLPATCVPGNGDVVFKTTATVGVYQCSATNTWAAAGGSGTTPIVLSFDTATNTCAISSGSGSCSASNTAGAGSNPGLVVTHNFNISGVPPLIVLADGAGSMFGSGTITSIVATSANQVTITFTGATSGTGIISTGSMGPTGSTGATGSTGSAGSSGQSVTVTSEAAGANCTYGGEKLVSVSGTAYVCNGAPGGGDVNKIANGTATLGTSSVSANSCASAVTVAATGVATTDTIIWTPNADISGVTGYGPQTTDGLIVYPYPTSNNVNFHVCNATGSSITPGAVTLNWRVVR